MTSGQCIQRSSLSAGTYLTLPCAYRCEPELPYLQYPALLIFEDHYLRQIDHCYGHHTCSLLALLIFVDHWLPIIFAKLVPSHSHPSQESDPRWYWVRYVSPLKFVQCDDAGWWPSLAGLVPAHRVAMEPTCCALYFCALLPTFDCTNSQVHQ